MATATIKTGYTPPFQGLPTTTAQQTTNSAGEVLTTVQTTTSTSTSDKWPVSATVTGPVNPTVPPRADDLAYVDQYLTIHQLSSPSMRYAYTMWFAFVLILLMLSLSHQLSRCAPSLSSTWNKFAIRRIVIKRRTKTTPGPRSSWDAEQNMVKAKKQKRKQPISLPSYSQMIAVSVMWIIPIVLCVIGSDYIFPQSRLFDYRSSFVKRASTAPQVILTPAYTIDKSLWTAGSRTGVIAFALFPLSVLLVIKSPPLAIFSLSFLTHMFYDTLTLLHKWSGRLIWLITAAHVVLWSIRLANDARGNGENVSVYAVVWAYQKFWLGWIAFISLTLLTFLSIAPIRKKFYETFYIIHVTLVPLTLITAALHFPKLWWWPTAAGGIWVLERLWRFLRYGWHNGWWGGLGRTAGNLKIDDRTIGIPAKTKTGDRKKKHESWEMGERPGSGTPATDSLGLSQNNLHGYNSIDVISPSRSHSGYLAYQEHDPPSHQPDFGPPQTYNLDEDASYDDTTYASDFGVQKKPKSHNDLDIYNPAMATISSNSSYPESFGGDENQSKQVPGRLGYTPESAYQSLVPLKNDDSYGNAAWDGEQSTVWDEEKEQLPMPNAPFRVANRQESTISMYTTKEIVIPRPIRAPIPAGYALAQLLPSRTVRLTLRLPKPFKWEPGQNILLQIREISIWTSHPFSIVSVADKEMESEIMLLVKARKGFTLDLWKETKRRTDQPEFDKHLSSAPTQYNGFEKIRESYYFSSGNKQLSTPKPVFFRALVDGPYGSSARMRWGNFGSVLIICGGSGVSFGIAILTYICECMSERDKAQIGGKGTRGIVTRRARFVWIVREFAEILWVSNLLRRCIDLVPASQLKIDIFVTSHALPTSRSTAFPSDFPESGGGGELLPPKPKFAGSRRDSQESMSSVTSADSITDLAYLRDASGEGDVYASGERDSVLELTNWDEDQDEDEFNRSPAELQLSQSVRREGKLRREKSKKRNAAKGKRERMRANGGQPSSSKMYEVPSAYPPPPMPYGSGTANPKSIPHVSPPANKTNRAFSPVGNSVPFASDEDSDHYNAPYGTPKSNFNQYTPNSIHQQLPPVSHSPSGGNLRHDSFSGARTPADSLLGDNRSSYYPPGGSESIRGLVDAGWDSTRDSFIRFNNETGENSEQFIDETDHEDLNVVAEMARPGRPRLDKIIEEEVQMMGRSMAVGSCGPSSLNSSVRNICAKHMSPKHLISVYTEEYGY